MCDLPDIKNGWSKEEISYGSEPLTHFQRKVKKKILHFDTFLKTIVRIDFIYFR